MPAKLPEPKASPTLILLLWAVTTLVVAALFTVPAGWVQDLAPQTVAGALGSQFCGANTTPEIRITHEVRSTAYSLACLDNSGRAVDFHYDDYTIAYLGLWVLPAALVSGFITWWFMSLKTTRIDAELQLA